MTTNRLYAVMAKADEDDPMDLFVWVVAESESTAIRLAREHWSQDGCEDVYDCDAHAVPNIATLASGVIE